MSNEIRIDGLPGSWSAVPRPAEFTSVVVPDELAETLVTRARRYAGDVDGMPVHASPFVPQGTAFLITARHGDHYSAYATDSLTVRENPWPEEPTGMPAYAARERDRALDFLADLLDDWCASTTVDGVALDPEEVWRRPKLNQARWRRDRIRFDATMHLGLTINRPESFVAIGSVT